MTLLTHAQIANRMQVRTCRGCGCDDDHACGEGCSWVVMDIPGAIFEDPTGVCSACVRKLEQMIGGPIVFAPQAIMRLGLVAHDMEHVEP